jgi:hypothetical protein
MGIVGPGWQKDRRDHGTGQSNTGGHQGSVAHSIDERRRGSTNQRRSRFPDFGGHPGSPSHRIER